MQRENTIPSESFELLKQKETVPELSTHWIISPPGGIIGTGMMLI